jgi:hypothetical protein
VCVLVLYLVSVWSIESDRSESLPGKVGPKRGREGVYGV